MDLGIAGRKAIVCASSRGLGRACAFRLAEADPAGAAEKRAEAEAARMALLATADEREGHA